MSQQTTRPITRPDRGAAVRARLAGLAATVVLLAAVVGLPVLLLALGANPIPARLPSLGLLWSALTSPDDGTLALGGIRVLAWAGWVFFTGAVLLELASRARGLRAPRLPGLGLPQAAAGNLLATAALLFVVAPLTVHGATPAPMAEAYFTTATAAATTAAPVNTSAPGASAPGTDLPGEAEPPPASARSAGQPAPPTQPAPRPQHTVEQGQTLWSIAEAHLGSGRRWPEIVALNPDALIDPDVLPVGAVLTLPAQDAGKVDPASTGASHGRGAYRHTVTVRPGDTLSGIARDELGDGNRYPDLVDASAVTTQPGGTRLSDPDHIEPGWTITIPGPLPSRDDSTPATAPRNTTGPNTHQPLHQQAARTGPGDTTTTASGRLAPLAKEEPQARDPQVMAPQAAAPARSAKQPSAPWILTGLTGGGAVLAGSMLMLLRRRRRSQFRSRRPGRTITTPEAVLVPVEKTLTVVGSTSAPTVEHMDQVLARLAASTVAAGRSMPEVAAVQLTGTDLVLHLGAPASLPAPWAGTADQLHWSMPSACDLDDVGAHVPDRAAPYPMLVTIGSGDEDDVWLLNLEDLDVTIAGDPTYAADFARYLVAEIACNPWSASVRADCVGVAHEVGPMNPDRIRVHGHDAHAAPDAAAGSSDAGWAPGQGPAVDYADDGDAGVAVVDAVVDPVNDRVDVVDEVAADVLTDAVATIDRLHHLDEANGGTSGGGAGGGGPVGTESGGMDVVSARAAQAGEESWSARLLVIDQVRAARPVVGQLRDLVSQHAGRTATAVITRGGTPSAAGVLLHLSGSGRVTMPVAGLDLVAVGLTSDEAQGCAALLEQSEDLRDAPVPVDPDAEAGWRSLTDEAGALRAEHTLARDTDVSALPEPACSVLAGADEEYVAVAATTTEDLQALAPVVTDAVRAKVEDADPTLDQDVAAWFSKDCPLPRLTLLGPVGARTRGVAVTKRKPYWTEMLAYLATRAHGATPEELADAFDVTPAKVREYARTVRDWLGVNPRTGGRHLPDAREAPAAQARGVGVYQVLDVLVDVDLFRRLRARGQARGPQGVTDLRTALRLVQGRPFDKLRPGGWGWLSQGERLDQHMTCAIVDVAHTLTTYAIHDGDLPLARLAAETASLAAPDEEIPRLDLAAVAAAEGNHHEARRIARDDVANRTDDTGPPAELPERTERILGAHGWLDGGQVAS